MPAAPKPLFRPESLRPKLSLFALPPAALSAREKLARWAHLLRPGKLAMKETELLPDFITDVFGSVLGYLGPASGAEPYTIKREATVKVDGKFADGVLGRFFTGEGKPQVVAALEGK